MYVSDRPVELTDQQFEIMKKLEGVSFSYSSRVAYAGQIAVPVKVVKQVGKTESTYGTAMDMDAGYLVGTPEAITAAFRIFGITTGLDVSTTVKTIRL